MNRILKKIFLSPFKFAVAVLDRVIALAGALIFFQYPVFFDQYIQRLGGHIDELKKITSEYNIAAIEHGKTLQEYLNLHLNAKTEEFVSTGKIMQTNIDRYTCLQNSLEELKASDPLSSIFVFIKEIDMSIFKAACINFTPGISFSKAGLLYGLMGLIIAMLLFYLLKKALQSLCIKSSGRNKSKQAKMSHSSMNSFSLFPGDHI